MQVRDDFEGCVITRHKGDLVYLRAGSKIPAGVEIGGHVAVKPKGGKPRGGTKSATSNT